MTSTDALTWGFAAVAVGDTITQSIVLRRVTARYVRSATEALIHAGVVRTICCRLLAAVLYDAMAVASLRHSANISLGFLVVFGFVRALYATNSVLDDRMRGRVARIARTVT